MAKKETIFLFASLCLFTIVLARVDRVFFKRDSSFCARFLYSSLPNNPIWELPTPGLDAELSKILEQKFHYLAKGAHCFAFISEDEKYVIKFHRYASHMRVFPWLNRPFSYYFKERRKKIKEYNFQRLSVNFTSYKNSDQILKDETGVILTHINRTNNLKKTITLVGKSRAEYQIPLDAVTFILQKKANLIYPTLEKLCKEKKLDQAKQVLNHIVNLIQSCCQKGFVDEDPILRRNYGLLEDRAIHIDVGDLVRNEAIMLRENYIPHIREITEPLRIRLQNHFPELLDHYYQAIQAVSEEGIL